MHTFHRLLALFLVLLTLGWAAAAFGDDLQLQSSSAEAFVQMEDCADEQIWPVDHEDSLDTPAPISRFNLDPPRPGQIRALAPGAHCISALAAPPSPPPRAA